MDNIDSINIFVTVHNIAIHVFYIFKLVYTDPVGFVHSKQKRVKCVHEIAILSSRILILILIQNKDENESHN